MLGAVYTARLRVPDGLEDTDRAAADTLGGAVDVAGQLPPDAAAALTASARDAFSSGVDLTVGIGAVVMLTAAALVAFVWPTPPAEA